MAVGELIYASLVSQPARISGQEPSRLAEA
jgi:hypothetical protein